MYVSLFSRGFPLSLELFSASGCFFHHSIPFSLNRSLFLMGMLPVILHPPPPPPPPTPPPPPPLTTPPFFPKLPCPSPPDPVFGCFFLLDAAPASPPPSQRFCQMNLLPISPSLQSALFSPPQRTTVVHRAIPFSSTIFYVPGLSFPLLLLCCLFIPPITQSSTFSLAFRFPSPFLVFSLFWLGTFACALCIHHFAPRFFLGSFFLFNCLFFCAARQFFSLPPFS